MDVPPIPRSIARLPVPQDVREAAGVDDALSGFAVDPHTTKLRGVNHDIRVFRIAPCSPSDLTQKAH